MECQINRNGAGWVFELANSKGINQDKDQPAIVEAKKAAPVRVRVRGRAEIRAM